MFFYYRVGFYRRFRELTFCYYSSSQTEQELNEKLADCLTKLQEAGVDKRDTEREVKFRETLATLKRTFPG